MKKLKTVAMAALLLPFIACGGNSQQNLPATENVQDSTDNQVIETIMARRSIRQYKPQPVGRDTMQIILNCGINAPNGQNKQSWAIRVVDNPEYISGITEIYKKKNPKVADDSSFKNMFRNAPTVVFIASDKSYGMSQIDCGLLGIWCFQPGQWESAPAAWALPSVSCRQNLKLLII